MIAAVHTYLATSRGARHLLVLMLRQDLSYSQALAVIAAAVLRTDVYETLTAVVEAIVSESARVAA